MYGTSLSPIEYTTSYIPQNLINTIQFEHGRLYLNLFLYGDTTYSSSGAPCSRMNFTSAWVELITRPKGSNLNSRGSFNARFFEARYCGGLVYTHMAHIKNRGTNLTTVRLTQLKSGLCELTLLVHYMFIKQVLFSIFFKFGKRIICCEFYAVSNCGRIQYTTLLSVYSFLG